MGKKRKKRPAEKRPRAAAKPPHAAARPPQPLAISQRQSFPVVGIGASAGGLEAFKRFLNAMPADNNMAFVLIPHLDPTHKSYMVDLLGRQSKMPVVEADQDMALQPEHVFIIPPGKYLTVKGGVLQLSGPIERSSSQTPLDVFFASLAEDQQENAICIILSGTGSHGTLGLKTVKAAGGLVIAQDPRTAEFDRMPQSAISTGLVDYVLAPEDIPQALLNYARTGVGEIGGDADWSDRVERELGRILTLLRTRTRYDFRWYRKRMLARRIQRRMRLNHIETVTDYLPYLREHPEEVKQLTRDLLISVTSFFRDADAYRVLETEIVPKVLELKRPDVSARVWVPGCATGEEAYSIAMVFLERISASESKGTLRVFATDADEHALDVGRQGVYPESVTADVAPERLQRFFVRADDNCYRVCKELRDSMTFAAQNLLLDAPFSKLDLISCRNVLIYLEPEIQKKVIALFHMALNEGGYLWLGPSETISHSDDLFEPVSKKWRIYRRVPSHRPERVEFPLVVHDRTKEPRPAPALSAGDFGDITQQLLLEEYSLAAVLINRKNEVVYYYGETTRFLELPTGEPTRDLLLLAGEGLRAKLRVGIHRATTEQQRVQLTGSRLKRHGASVPVRITVKPVKTPRNLEGLLLVIFEEEPAAQAPAIASGDGGAEDTLVRHLEMELGSTREELQGTIEELESSNEQLKASNEEIMSMNEELQSANEELETSKEELQSLNEELNTVNAQLNEKVNELESTNNDLANLFTSTDTATLFLDRNFCIKRYTPSTTKLLSLITTDIGRPITDISEKYEEGALLDDTREVQHTLFPKETEIHTRDGRWYLRRVAPYRTLDNRIEGTVVTFTDVTQLKTAAERLRRLASVVVESNDAVVVYDFEGNIRGWNRGAERMYGYTEAEALQLKVEKLLPSDAQNEFMDRMQALRRGENVPTLESQRVRRDGQFVDVSVTLTGLREMAAKSMRWPPPNGTLPSASRQRTRCDILMWSWKNASTNAT
jgi:two-component system CheB/CheR fusion protein